jgi:hypothetical protein
MQGALNQMPKALIPQKTRLQNLVRLSPPYFVQVPTDAKADMHGFLNQAWVLEALGVPVNFSYSSRAVATAFDGTADLERAGSSEAVSYLLDSGAKVHMMYGDRDYACNWLGGEAASLGIDYSGGENFRQAGYAPILTSNGKTGGFVRQYGNFSFSRVFQAGHEGESMPFGPNLTCVLIIYQFRGISLKSRTISSCAPWSTKISPRVSYPYTMT